MNNTSKSNLTEELDYPKTLEQLKKEQRGAKEKRAARKTITEIPKEYSDRVFKNEEPTSSEVILRRIDHLTARPQKQFENTISFDDARQYVWEICKRKSELQNRKFEVDDSNRALIQNLIKYFIGDQNCEWDLNKGLMFLGDVGLGKTYLMSVMKTFADAAKIDFRKFKFKVCADIVDEVEEKGTKEMQKYYRDDVDICFDDLGQEPTTTQRYGNVTSVMERILTKRYNNFVNGKCITHVTTNLLPAEIEEIYGTRLSDRCNEMFTKILIKGKSRRR